MCEVRASALVGTLPLRSWGILSGGVKHPPGSQCPVDGLIFLGLFVALERIAALRVYVCVCLGNSQCAENLSFSTGASTSTFLPPRGCLGKASETSVFSLLSSSSQLLLVAD